MIGPAGSGERVAVTVRGRVVAKIVALPSVVYFDVMETSGVLQRLIVVRRTDGRPLLGAIRVSTPIGFRAEELMSDGKDTGQSARRLRVILDTKCIPPDFTDEKILLTLEDSPEPIAIPVLVRLKK